MHNKYDDKDFFEAYKNMSRSKGGLGAAGEWRQLQKLIPDLLGSTVLDLGCGYGWHSKYAIENGATSVLAIDISEKMIEKAKKRNADSKINYVVMGIEEYEYPEDTFDFVISNLVLHYIKNLENIFALIYGTLKPGGKFVFNIEHPTFTSGVNQDWIYNEDGKPLYWPVDDYFYPGERETNFLGHTVRKEHHTLTQILMELINSGFVIEVVEEVQPTEEMIKIQGMEDEMKRPMMLLVRVGKE